MTVTCAHCDAEVDPDRADEHLAEHENEAATGGRGWHPNPGEDAEAMNELLRDELDACQAEIARLRAQNKLLADLRDDPTVRSMGCGVYRVTPT